MATYRVKRRGYAMPHRGPHEAPYQANIDIPDIIANGGLTDTSNVDATLASTGFGAADVLQVFFVPAGFVVTPLVGVWVTTVEGAVCAGTIGNASATQTHRKAAAAGGFEGSIDFNSATAQITLVTDSHLGFDTYQGVVFITNGTIDITFSTAATETCIFDVWACGWKCF